MAKKARIGPKGRRKVRSVMREFAGGGLHIGRSTKRVRSRKQAVAIALSEGRRVSRRGHR